MVYDIKESVSWTDANPVLTILLVLGGSTVVWNLGIILLAWIYNLSQ